MINISVVTDMSLHYYLLTYYNITSRLLSIAIAFCCMQLAFSLAAQIISNIQQAADR